jgi:hypothetical protein
MSSSPETAPKPKKSVALSGVVAGNTALCTVGRSGNDLHYRGYDILEFADLAEFEEIAYLLVHERLPNRQELKAYKNRLKKLRGLPKALRSALEQLPKKAHPMDVMRTGVSVLGTLEPEKDDHGKEGALCSPSPHFRWEYHLDKTQFQGFLQELAELYADPKRKVMSLWTMGFNQHVRGVWANQLVYNIHLLTGKISEPGNSPFSLTGQPSACGTAREVGTFAHRLPADMVVTNPEHRKHAEEIWKLPHGTIPDVPGYHAVLQNRMLKDGKLNAYWVMVNNNMQAGANLMQEGYPGYRNPDNFIVVSDVYPTVTALSADLILPAAMWVEKEGAYGNAERRTHFWHQLVSPPGEARSDLWQLMEFSKRFRVEAQMFAAN